MVRIPLRVTSTATARVSNRRLPLSAGIPLPKGAVAELTGWSLSGPDGRPLPLEIHAAERWHDGSLRWVLVDTQVDTPAGEFSLPLTLVHEEGLGAAVARPADVVDIRRTAQGFAIDTGTMTADVSTVSSGLITQSRTGSMLCARGSGLVIRGADGVPWAVEWAEPVVDVHNSLRALLSSNGTAKAASGESLALSLHLEFYAGSGVVRLRLRARNTKRAAHPGGIWELGDGGSVLISELSYTLDAASLPGTIVWSAEPGQTHSAATNVRVYQDSSGGENWSSSNHITRTGEISTSRRGYAVSVDGASHVGNRATPTVLVGSDSARVGMTVPAFWENFPRALGATQDHLCASFFPPESPASELQGGEQKTHELFILLGDTRGSEQPLSWCLGRPVLHAEPSWYAESGALPFLVTADEDVPEYRSLVNAAVEGPDTFFHKREVADEYGWRHFGDIYGDHEAVFHKGTTPLMSHYNNQYDPVGGFLCQFMRTGDARWWTQAGELASHVVDIDIYHTNEDKAAYNHGLFWHTYHYVDAGKAMHRSYPTGTVGGGPSSEQNYPTGLMLHYLMTGDAASRDAALGLAKFVIDIDDGTKTIFRFLSRSYTGIASASRSFDYHGPGRGSGNSLNALVDGHRITGDRTFLIKAEQIIRRCTHPLQDIEALNLLDPENRWFYTMYLQALAKYLDWKAELNELDDMYAYGQAVLLHFGQWMASNERPYLSRPDLLEYPTETWAAQDIRKSEIFDAVARHTTGDARDVLLERADFFYNYCVQALSEMPTRSLARPVVLLLFHGHRRMHRKFVGVTSAPVASGSWSVRWPAPQAFVPQKAIALKRAKLLALALGVIGLFVLAELVQWWLG